MITNFTKLPVLLVAMFLVDSLGIFSRYEFRYQTATSLIILILGVLVIAIGGYTFRKVNTTVNPMTPELTSHLVKEGIYSTSRNPMYLGFFLGFWHMRYFFGI